MTNYIETKEEFNNSADNFDWEIPNPTDLAGLEYGSDEETAALDSLLTTFQNENDVELDWESRNAWEDIARDFYNTNTNN
ncbi:hypothetical protein [Glutamicibacter ardleyensis]|uniref:hypothetical protein n=1 Tax=Glutamicibacter ardleyensis TaxID=225894 RepID=UPI003FD5C0AB